VSQSSDEAILIQKAKSFDSDAWAQIYQSYYRKIFVYVHFRLLDTGTAEDLTADVFLRAVERIGSFEYRGAPLLAWLYRIARNLTVDYLRQKSKMKTQRLVEETLAEDTPIEDTTEQLLVRDELNAAIKNLTDDQREVVLLKFIGGLSNAEVAQTIRKSEGAVKALQFRALASLRRILKEWE
jgi:RNA polymerase sigma-70 factor, ECF subfamily